MTNVKESQTRSPAVQQLRVFISSTMKDLVPERTAAKEVIARLGLEPVMAEEFVPGGQSPHRRTLAEVARSDIYLGIFGQRYGTVGNDGLSATEHEFREAQRMNRTAQRRKIPMLVYVKKPCPNRDIQLTRFLKDVGDYGEGCTWAEYRGWADLGKKVERAIPLTVAQLVRTVPDGVGEPNVAFVELVRDFLTARLKQDLSPSVRDFRRPARVDSACRVVAEEIRKDAFAPELVVAWEKTTNGNADPYHGSREVANLLSQYLGLKSPRIVDVEETPRGRRVVTECMWARRRHRILIVDDAAYSGTTLSAIREALYSVNKRLDIRCAVLSKHVECPLREIYYAVAHRSDELLFPWGWSRSMPKLAAVLEGLGMLERHSVTREQIEGADVLSLAKEHVGPVHLWELPAKTKVTLASSRDYDSFLFVLRGRVRFSVGKTSATFVAREYLFVPRMVSCGVSSIGPTKMIELRSVRGL